MCTYVVPGTSYIHTYTFRSVVYTSRGHTDRQEDEKGQHKELFLPHLPSAVHVVFVPFVVSRSVRPPLPLVGVVRRIIIIVYTPESIS